MRVKIGTSVDHTLLRRLQSRANTTGRHLNELLEEAIEAYLARIESEHDDVVGRTWGTFKIDRRSLERMMDEDVYES